jgi:hypothetical protein
MKNMISPLSFQIRGKNISQDMAKHRDTHPADILILYNLNKHFLHSSSRDFEDAFLEQRGNDLSLFILPIFIYLFIYLFIFATCYQYK